MAEIVKQLNVILIYDAEADSLEVLNTGTIGSDDAQDSRTRNVSESQRTASSGELAGTLRDFLDLLVTRIRNEGGI